MKNETKILLEKLQQHDQQFQSLIYRLSKIVDLMNKMATLIEMQNRLTSESNSIITRH